MTEGTKDRLAWLTLTARNLSAITVVLTFLGGLWGITWGPIRGYFDAQTPARKTGERE